MEVLVVLEETPDHSPVLAQVNSVPSPLTNERPSRDVVTLFGVPSAESLALALAAVLESRRATEPGADRPDAVRHLGVWPGRGAVGDAAWRDPLTGDLVSRDVEIPLVTLGATAGALLSEFGHSIRRRVAGLRMADWPEGARRAITFYVAPSSPSAGTAGEAIFAALRETPGLTYDSEEWSKES